MMSNTIISKRSQIVCILGMHRSGTSLVARILNLLGVYLGPEEHLIHPMQDNPTGFWENSQLTAINNEILLHYGGDWSSPPKFPPEWHRSADLEYLRQRARHLVSTDFHDSCSWGWKDPRNSLTLPFWDELVQPTHYIICLRNPLDVVRSLQQRNGFSADTAGHLWTHYVANAIVGTAEQRRSIVFFEDIVQDWKSAVHNLAAFVDSAALEQNPDGMEDSIRQFIEPGLVHYSASALDAMGTPDLRSSTKSLYFVLREGVWPATAGQYLGSENGDTPATRLAAFAQSVLDTKRDEINQLHSRLMQEEKRVNELRVQMEAGELENSTLRSDAIALRAQLEDMSSGLAFGLLAHYRSWIEEYLPLGSRRRELYFLVLKALRILTSEGLSGVWSRILSGRWRVVLTKDRDPNAIKEVHRNESIVITSIEHPAAKKQYAATRGDLIAPPGGDSAQDKYVPEAQASFSPEGATVRLIAFYLTQFHPIPENDIWWGKGFTDWINVARAVPQFAGHYQPHLPDELGFYDLRIPEVQQRQVELARKYGLYGFCFYYYWFNGKRLLERPLEQYLANTSLDFPFCLCWANENWTRKWDGREDQVLMVQRHTPEDDFSFIRAVAPIMRDKRYIRIGDRPILIVYRASQLWEPVAAVKRWRQYCQEVGVANPYLIAAQTFRFTDPRRVGFDAAMEFPPHNVHPPTINHSISILNPAYQGNVFRYDSLANQLSITPRTPYKLYKTVFPGWDNEPRRPGRGSTFAFSTPRTYQEWLANCARYALQDPDPETHLVFINAWNEWAEGAHLEPDRKYGYAYLQATADALHQIRRPNSRSSSGDLEGERQKHVAAKAVNKDPVIVFQMGKVGSKTMERSLKAAYESLSLQVPIYHVHMLNDIDTIEERVRRERRNPVGTLKALQRGRDMRQLLDGARDRHWRVITLVREPVGRNVATLFQNMDEYIPDWKNRYDGHPDKLLDDLQAILLTDETISMAPEWWFQTQLEAVFGIDVFDEAFPKDIGYKTYENLPFCSLLLIRLEDMNKCAASAIESFLGIERFQLMNTNIGASKDYGSVYRAFLDRPLPPEYLRKEYATDFARNFYTEEEIAAFRLRWGSRTSIVQDEGLISAEAALGLVRSVRKPQE